MKSGRPAGYSLAHSRRPSIRWAASEGAVRPTKEGPSARRSNHEPARQCPAGFLLTLSLILTSLTTNIAAGEGHDGWGEDLNKAAKQAEEEGKLILLFVSDGTGNSSRMKKVLDVNPAIRCILDESFVKVTANKGDNLAELRMLAPRRYPSSIMLTPTRRPVRQVDGIVSAQKYAEQLKIAVSQFEKTRTMVWTPRQWKKGTGGKFVWDGRHPSQPARVTKEYSHTRTCPTLCTTCDSVRGKALWYLAKAQNPDGSWSRKKHVDESDAEALDFVDVSLTALALVAFRSEGSSTDGGTYSENVRKALDYLTKAAREDGEFCQKKTDEIFFQIYSNWHTALAAWALAESPKAFKSVAHRERMANAARYLEKQQDPRDGAWGYGKFWKTFGRDNSWGLVNVGTTHLTLSTLRLLGEHGIAPDKEVLARGDGFLKSCRGRAGGYGYDPAKRLLEYPGSTGGVLVAHAAAGGPLDLDWNASYRFLRLQMPVLDAFKKDECLNFFHLFTALALDLCSPDDYHDYWVHYRDEFVSEQADDGSWDSPIAGKSYATAIRLIVMHLPRRNLQIQKFRVTPPAPETYYEKNPAYLKSDRNQTQQKVFKLKKKFAAWEKYGIDLVVQVGDVHADEQEKMLTRLFLGTAPLLYDLTDGQFRLNKVTLTWKKVAKPDIMFTRNTHFDIHGIARTMRKLVNGRETAVVERDVILPLDSAVWKGPAGPGVVAHELSHYFFGMPDEFAQDTKRAYCPGCIMAGSWTGATEYCSKQNHKDTRNPASCWELMKAAYPLVVIPKAADPGPHLCPPPVVESVK